MSISKFKENKNIFNQDTSEYKKNSPKWMPNNVIGKCFGEFNRLPTGKNITIWQNVKI